MNSSLTPFMSVSSAGSILNRLLQRGRHRTPPRHSDAARVAKQILHHLNSDDLSSAVSALFASPEPVPLSLYERLFHLCAAKSATVEARKVESHLLTFFPSPPTFLLNRAIETFGKCGCLGDAKGLFDEMRNRDGGSWNALIFGYLRNGGGYEALGLFSRMNGEGVRGNEITFVGVLGSCVLLLDLSVLRQVHGIIAKSGFPGNVILQTSLVDVYGKCGAITDAGRMFNEIENPNQVSWNVIVRRYLEAGEEEKAVRMFFKMVEQGVRPLNHTISSAIVACSNLLALPLGMEIHGVIIKTNFEEDKVVSSSLIDIYVKCGKLDSARRIFDQPGPKDLITWTSIISGYAMSGRAPEARELFDKMPERNVVSWNAMLAGYSYSLKWEEALDFVTLMCKETSEVDHITLGLILNVCSGLSNVEIGKQVHGFTYRHGFNSDVSVGNALLDMYGRCGSLRNANILFHQMSESRDKVSWNALLTSYARHGRSELVLSFFGAMKGEAKPSKFTFATLVAACANISAPKKGKEIHGFMIRNGCDIDVVIRGALVDMYCKCRCLYYAFLVFVDTDYPDLVLWNSLILGCCYNGQSKEVFRLITDMEEEGIKPDHVTFQGVLLACVHEGLIGLGTRYFNSMSSEYCIIPRVEHYECMVELYCRYGCIEELKDFVDKMPFDPTVRMLTRMLDSSKRNGFLTLGEWAAERLKESNHPHITLSEKLLHKIKLSGD